ncbi:MAG TPA: hypothetical protein VGL77_05835 [Armatimonadota bacterium]|jgi:predicted nucleic acid-binding Zn ribbon protein
MTTSPNQTPHRCATCGTEYPATILVCPECRTLLVQPGARPRTPAWVIVLLSLIIVALLVYILVLSRQIMFEHRF